MKFHSFLKFGIISLVCITIITIIWGVIAFMKERIIGYFVLASGILFLIISIFNLKLYQKYSEEEELVKFYFVTRMKRDVLIPLFISFFFLFIGIINFYSGNFDVGIVSLTTAFFLFLLGIMIYWHNKKINL